MRLSTMFSIAFVFVGLVLSSTIDARAEGKADFLDGTYATKEGCEKLKLLAAGVEKNVETVPETLTAEGFETWEGGCSFHSVKEIDKGKRWTGLMDCVEGETEAQETDTFEKMLDGSIKVTADGKSTTFYRCAADKGN